MQKLVLLSSIAIIGIVGAAIIGMSPIQSACAEEDNTAKCISRCDQQYRNCSDNGTKNVPACLKRRKDCYDSC